MNIVNLNKSYKSIFKSNLISSDLILIISWLIYGFLMLAWFAYEDAPWLLSLCQGTQ
ncbi:hypothetical protein MCEMIEM12_01267 [Burkholderiaceae bacterium]|jgi:hypothetical protein